MTIKKTIISTVAAGALAAMVTGCGSSDDSGSSSYGKSITAVDGYIYNATMTATYLNDNNNLVQCGYNTDKTIVNSKGGTVEFGSATYKASRACSGENPLYYTLDADLNRTGLFDGSGNLVEVSFIDANGDKDYTNGTDVAMNTTLRTINMPSVSIVSPLTEMMYVANQETITDATEIDSETQALINAEVQAILPKLGLDADLNVFTTDPVRVTDTNPTYRLINALLGENSPTVAEITALKATADATNVVEALNNIVTSGVAKANTDTVINAMLSYPELVGEDDAATSANILEAVKNGDFNLELSVDNGALTESGIVNANGKLVVTGSTINDVATSSVVENGDKIESGLANVILTLKTQDDTLDQNIDTNATTESLLVKVGASKATNGATATNYEVVLNIPVTVSIADGATTVDASNETIKYAVKGLTTDTAPVEVASTTLAQNINGLITNKNGTGLSVDVDAIYALIMAAKATDINDSASGAGITAAISAFELAMTNDSGILIGANANGNAVVLPTADFDDNVTTEHNLSVSGAVSLIKVTETDFRADYTGSNATPQNVMTATSTTGAASTKGDGYRVINSGVQDVIFKFAGDTSADKAFEKNSSIVLGTVYGANDISVNTITSELNATGSAGTGKLTLADHDADDGDAITNLNKIETNTTVQGQIIATIPYTVTDEFDKSNTSELNVTVNRAPTGVMTSTAYTITDFNTTAGKDEVNSSIVGVAQDLDYENNNVYEFDYGNNYIVAINAGGVTNRCEGNITIDSTPEGVIIFDINQTGSGASDVDNNVSEVSFAFMTTATNEINMTMTVNDINKTGVTWSDGQDINFTISDYNVSDRFGAIRQITDSNITINMSTTK